MGCSTSRFDMARKSGGIFQDILPAVIGVSSIQAPTSQAEYQNAPRASHEAPAEAPRPGSILDRFLFSLYH